MGRNRGNKPSPKKSPVIANPPSTNEKSDRCEIISMRDEIDFLKTRVANLETEVVRLKSQQAVSETVSSHLSKALDSLKQYSHRSCVTITGIPTERNLAPEHVEQKVKTIMANSGQTDLAKEIYKAHFVGRAIDGKRKIIVKFLSHSKRYQFYKERKSLPKGICVQPSLTRHRE